MRPTSASSFGITSALPFFSSGVGAALIEASYLTSVGTSVTPLFAIRRIASSPAADSHHASASRASLTSPTLTGLASSDSAACSIEPTPSSAASHAATVRGRCAATFRLREAARRTRAKKASRGMALWVLMKSTRPASESTARSASSGVRTVIRNLAFGLGPSSSGPAM